jgi:hypothetical protein
MMKAPSQEYGLGAQHQDGSIRLFLRIIRRLHSGIYIVFAAGQNHPGIKRKAYEPHSSWHTDGRVHHKSYDRILLPPEKKQRLDAFKGAERFVATPVDQMLACTLPECKPEKFIGVMEVAVSSLDVTPGRQQLYVDLVELGSMPLPIECGERLLVRWWLNDAAPSIVVSLYEFSTLYAAHPRR